MKGWISGFSGYLGCILETKTQTFKRKSEKAISDNTENITNAKCSFNSNFETVANLEN